MLCTPSLRAAQRFEDFLAIQVRIALQIRIGELRRARCVVGGNRLGLDVGQREQQRRNESGPILARDTMEQQRLRCSAAMISSTALSCGRVCSSTAHFHISFVHSPDSDAHSISSSASKEIW